MQCEAKSTYANESEHGPPCVYHLRLSEGDQSCSASLCESEWVEADVTGQFDGCGHNVLRRRSSFACIASVGG